MTTLIENWDQRQNWQIVLSKRRQRRNQLDSPESLIKISRNTFAFYLQAKRWFKPDIWGNLKTILSYYATYYSTSNCNVRPKSPQITPEVPKVMHVGHIFFTGPRQPNFLHCPTQLPKARQPPILQIALRSLFLFKKWKKYTRGHN